MKDGPWVKWYAGDFLNGIAVLDHYEIAVYALVLNRIYDEGGPIVDDADEIARRCRMRLPQCIKALDRLCSMPGKLIRENGQLDNERARREIEKRQKRSKTATSNVQARWNKEKESPNENKDDAIPLNADGNTNAILTRSQKLEARIIIPQSSNGSAHADDDKVTFDQCDHALRQIEGISAHPVSTDLVIAPIWQLVTAGYDLRTQIVPSIAQQVAKQQPGKLIKGWSYFVKGIVESARQQAVPPPPPKAAGAIWEGWTDRQYQAAIIAAKRGGRWPETFGPVERIPEHLVDDELKRILRRAA